MMAEGKETIASQLFPRYVKFPQLNGKTVIKHEGQVATCSNRIVFQFSIQLSIEKQL